ncbi:ornithine carbamoyltransferase-like [Ylistrum balloti]|uniref:ornithine carbamoyltransferase-like n=1 Tax=Ylistrum balloti TaxID=509963 RepID=UPI002905DC98|nr:ornithine carbamoyltransferase-like [Ylistrum balloti]
MKQRHFLKPSDFSYSEINQILKETLLFKKRRETIRKKTLTGKIIGLFFQKSSTRTRISFEVGIKELGGENIFLTRENTQVKRGESFSDTFRVLERYFHCLIIRNNDHDVLENLSKTSTIPIINGLSNRHHPCQVLADAFTINEHVAKPKIAYVGDGNNVATSLIELCSLLKWPLRVTTPPSHACPKSVLKDCLVNDRWIEFNHHPQSAVKGCNVIYTDTWFSMGDKESKANKLKAFKGFQVNDRLLKDATKDYIFLHCLPAYRGLEVSESIIDGKHSKVFDQAENRLHVQKAILSFLFTQLKRR